MVRGTKVKKGYGVGGEQDRYGTSYMSEQKRHQRVLRQNYWKEDYNTSKSLHLTMDNVSTPSEHQKLGPG